MTAAAQIVAPVPARPVIMGDTALRRCVDVTVAIIGMAGAAPLLVVLAAAVRMTSRGPVLFRQTRVGRNERPFEIWKLRTMIVSAPSAGPLVSGTSDPRITRIGSWLRRTRMDELPQLVNLLRGDLTLVGPRPEVSRFIPYYTHTERQMLRVRPGIIGPGALLFAAEQAGELDAVDDPDAHYTGCHLHPRLALDLDYLAHRGLRRDLALVAQAVSVCAGGA
ncbi:MAG: sugar transferase [Actinomycetota bacterium]|nr:sugar transferase [Actinomycetota bacterium]